MSWFLLPCPPTITNSLIRLQPSLITVLKKSGKLHEIYDNIVSFHDGFYRGNADRGYLFRGVYLKRWLDSRVFEFLSELTKVYSEDAATLVRIIVERCDDEFRQL